MVLKLFKSHGLHGELRTKRYLSPQESLPRETANTILAINKDNVSFLSHKSMYIMYILSFAFAP